MMSFEEFVEKVVKGVADAMGHEYEVTARTVSKNNGITLTGVVIVKKAAKLLLQSIWMKSTAHMLWK